MASLQVSIAFLVQSVLRSSADESCLRRGVNGLSGTRCTAKVGSGFDFAAVLQGHLLEFKESAEDAVLRYAICYAIYGNDLAYGPTRCSTFRSYCSRSTPLSPYALALRCPVLT